VISFPVVKNLDVRKQALVKLLFIRESFAVNPFDFQGFKKDLRHGIIVAIAFAAHTLDLAYCTLRSDGRITPPGGWRCRTAISKARASVVSVVNRLL